jgi:hypothetical protein
MTKVKQGRGVRYPLASQIDPTELAEHRRIVEGVFAGFVGQAEPVSDAVHPQHPLQANQRTAVAGFRVMRFDQGTELSPRNQPFHASQTLHLAPRPVVLLESSGRCQRHLLHRLVPCDHHSPSDYMTKQLFTVFYLIQRLWDLSYVS